MNNVRKSIGWADYTWNPIKGLCPVGCWYCYARSIYNRFHLGSKPWLDIAALNEVPSSRLTGKRIFVCSTFDLFHPVAMEITGRCSDGANRPARDLIFDAIEKRPDLTFQILTKLPENIDRPMPANVWLGVSVTGASDDWYRVPVLREKQAKVRFVSYEPALGCFIGPKVAMMDWLIVGRLTGHGKKHDPTPDELDFIRRLCAHQKLPLFEKSNLTGLVDGPLIQEWPR